jgi:hypothetical protein
MDPTPENNLPPMPESWGHWPGEPDLLNWCHNMHPGTAIALILLGIVYLAFGYYLFKALVTLNLGLMGAYFGHALTHNTTAPWAGAVFGAFIAAALAWPLMKYAVALTGGLFGAVLGASIWRVTNLPPDLHWAGALTGMIAFGLLSFVIFKHSVMLFLCLQGAVMLVLGGLGISYKYQSLSADITHNFTGKPFLLPMAICVPMLLGLIFQHSHAAQIEAAHSKQKKG